MESRVKVVSVKPATRKMARSHARIACDLAESVLMGNPGLAIETSGRGNSLGMQSALDEPATASPGLKHFAQLTIDRLKLDRSFAQRITTESKAAAIVRSLMNLGRDPGVSVTAEGIETEHELGMLDAAGCAQGQGHLLARPLPFEQTRRVLEQSLSGSHCGGGDLHAA